MSVEEDRLWNIVRANSSDFNAWTTLIEEAETVVEDNILKIRKVYDAFLAEFALRYGYWKKYADHEARLGSIDKVVEVYERAVQDVTYSVDIWLHYCIFAISTYGDPDTVRRWLDEAEEFIMSMPEKPNSVIWGALLGACWTHGDLRRGNLAFKHLTELEPMSSDRYKLAGIMFANTGENESASEIQKLIGENELETTRGMSFIKIDGAVHEFVVGTIHHNGHKEIYNMWNRVHRLLVIDEIEIRTPFFTLEDCKTAKNGSSLMDMQYS